MVGQLSIAEVEGGGTLTGEEGGEGGRGGRGGERYFINDMDYYSLWFL